MQGLILAAGLGSRMKELTQNSTKSMVEVNGKSLIERLLRQLDGKVDNIIVVDGYKSEIMQNFIKSLNIKTPVEFVTNKIYNETNNIYSVYLAKEHFFRDDTILIESDLIFADEVIEKVIKSPDKNLAVVSKFESWMDGTVIKYDNEYNITDFIDKKSFDFSQTNEYYKTVNIYKFSKEFSQNVYFPFMEAQMLAFGKNEYYETVLKTISRIDPSMIKALDIKDIPWYEVDDAQDLDVASTLFNTTPEKKFHDLEIRYGGYWRYPKVIDFCYLVNPFFPPKRMLEELKANLPRLVVDYPSGLKVNNSLVAKYYGIPEEYVIVGNGAAELIKAEMENSQGMFGVISPTFEEYPNRISADRIMRYTPSKKDYSYNSTDIINYFDKNLVDNIVLINPDNPTGNYIPKEEVLKIIGWAAKREINVILDESFTDFVDFEENPSLIDKNILEKYENLTLIKSISKSFGVPGVRLGFMMSSNLKNIEQIKANLSIWNINSFGEFFLQIFEKYKNDYKSGLQLFYEVRKEFYNQLSDIPNLEVISSQSNYFTCRLTGKMTAKELSVRLLNERKILIKNLSEKVGFDNHEYIRVAVKRSDENRELVNGIKEILD